MQADAMASTRRTRVSSYRRKDGTRVRGHEKTVHVSNGKSATASALREKAGDSAEGLGYYTGLLGRAIKDGVKSCYQLDPRHRGISSASARPLGSLATT